MVFCAMLETTETKRQLPTESLVRLFLNDEFLTFILCTPHHLKEMVIGWLLGQGMIQHYDDILSLSANDRMTDLAVHLKSNTRNTNERFKPILVPGCGAGQINSSCYFEDVSVVESKQTTNIEQCRRVLSLMFKELLTADAGTGLHCAAICNPGDDTILAFSYDIGRHNAVDKVIGAAMLRFCNFHEMILATSGRVSSDMVIKAATAGIPILVSPRSVTTLASELAKNAGIGIAGRLGKSDLTVVGNRSRIRGENCRKS